MYADSSTTDGVPNDPSTVVATSGEAKPATKMVHCETCGFSLNSETQAVAHYSGKSHLKRLQQLKHGNQATPSFRPYKPRPAAAVSWSTQTQTMTRWGTQLQQPRKANFSAVQTNFRFGSPNASSLSFEQNQTISSLGYSFKSFESTTSTGNYLPSTRCFDQSTGPFGLATNPPVQTNQNPVTKAVIENFLGILPTKRRKIVNCHVCGLVFNSDSQAEAHFQGSKHKRKVQLTSGAPVPAEDESKNTNAAEKTQPPSATLLYCDACHVSVNSQKQLVAHNQGMNHKSKLGLTESGKTELQPWTAEVQQGQKGGWFFCATCNISVPTSAALGQHVLSAEHNNKKPVEGL